MRNSLVGCLQPHVVGVAPGTTVTRLYVVSGSLSGGNLVITNTDTGASSLVGARLSPNDGAVTVAAQTGKKYLEVVPARTSGSGTAKAMIGLAPNANVDGVSGKLTQENLSAAGNYNLNGIGYNGLNVGFIANGVNTSDAAYGYNYGDVIGIAVDFSTGKVWFRKNGTWIAGDPVAGTGQTLTLPNGNFQFASTVYLVGGGESGDIYSTTWRPARFQQTYSPPSGFSAYG